MSEFRSRRRLRNGLTKMVWLSRLSTFIFFGLIAGILLVAGLFVWYGKDLPAPGKLTQAQQSQSTRIFDRNGELLYSVYQDTNRIYVNLSDIPKNLQNATISVEDKNFYNNIGFSPVSYLRVLRDVVFKGELTGGSGLTQQLVRNTLITSERTLPRKIKELILSIQVDKKYSKDQILEMYLNDVPYGGTNVGVEAAAEYYFGKHVKELDLAQSAFLAGLPQSPTTYNPFGGNKYYLDRTKVVLDSMVNNGYISQKQDESAYAEIKNYQFEQQDTSIKAPHFVMYVKQLLEDQLHFTPAMVENGGLQVTTTLDYKIEKQVEEDVKTEIGKLNTKTQDYNVHNAAAMVTDAKTGEVLAMDGNTDYFDKTIDGNYNDALAPRQPGSSLKPIMYATAFEKGYTPATMIMDVKTDFPTGDPTSPSYSPVNYDGKFHGPVQLRTALANSMNIPAVKMLALSGIKDVMTNAYNMGIENWQPTTDNMKNVGLSLVLGGRETTLLNEMTAYGVFATSGIRQDPVFILKVTDSKGNVLYQWHQQDGPRVIPQDITFLISDILSDNNARALEFGTHSWLYIPGRNVAVKTGTTDDKRDNWTMGYTPSYVVGVWVGNNDNSPMNQAISSGVTGASPIWYDIMTQILKGKPNENFPKPDDVTQVTIDSTFGGLPFGNQPTRQEYFIKGTEPTASSSVYQNKDGKTYYVIKENDPVSTDGQNRWQAGIDQWIKDNHSAADSQWYPPSDLVNQSNPTPTPH
ncbi:MAG TPA: transglycosylase domain-containing protein [Patescibacteria group bacterium]